MAPATGDPTPFSVPNRYPRLHRIKTDNFTYTLDIKFQKVKGNKFDRIKY